MIIEIAKLLAAVLFGGVAAAFITEWFRRRREKVQRVQLIERVNRVVSALDGFTMARPSGPGGALVEVKDLREYQLTLRNSTSTHLVDVEVEFQFPAGDVQALVSLPTMSRTPLVLKPVNVIKGATGFRWAIPNFPTGDSVEFTFRAVAAPSDKYEVALYSPGMVIERVVGEPPPRTQNLPFSSWLLALLVAVILAVAIGLVADSFRSDERILRSDAQTLDQIMRNVGNAAGIVGGVRLNRAGCDLLVSSDAWTDTISNKKMWRARYHMLNVGDKDCTIQATEMDLTTPTSIKAGDSLVRERPSTQVPILGNVDLTMGASSTKEIEKVKVKVLLPR